MKIGVIGGGSWGTALAELLAVQGNEVLVWCHEPELVESINTTHENHLFLQGFSLSKSLRATNDLEEVVRDQAMILSVNGVLSWA